MNPKIINIKEAISKSHAKYFYMLREKPVTEHKGETVEEFLTRGGKIEKIENKTKKSQLKRDSSGKFLKEDASVV